MDFLKKFENKIQNFLETICAKISSDTVHPKEIFKKIQKSIDDSIVQGLSITYAPNIFIIKLNPSDYEKYLPIKNSLTKELNIMIKSFVDSKNYMLTNKINVEITSDNQVSQGMCVIETQMQESAEISEQDLQSKLMSETITKKRTGAIAKLRVISGEEIGKEYDIKKTSVKIGRSIACDIQIKDTKEEISRQHFEIFRTGGQFYISDIGSANGTIVNGKKIKQAPLESNTKITIGSTELEFIIL